MNEEEIIKAKEKLNHCVDFYERMCEINGVQPILTGEEKNAIKIIINEFDKQQKENQQLKEQLQQKEDIINKANNFIKEYEKNRNCFKWNEEDYIDVINEIKQILDNKGE